MSGNQANQNNLSALNYLGKEVTAKGGKVELKEGVPASVYYDLSKQASEVGINIYDAEGRLVRTIHDGSKEQGLHNFSWDGKGNQGEKLSNGVYQFETFAKDAEGEKINVTGRIHGTVTGLNYKEGEPYLVVGSIEIPAAEVVEIKQIKEGSL
jgi:flagellar basal-body rod modification protein FlgD